MLYYVVAMNKKQKNIQPVEAAAWAGTALIIIGYGLFSLGLLPSALPYHVMNLLGSAAVAAISYRRKVWQPFVVNACFTVFAAFAIVLSLA